MDYKKYKYRHLLLLYFMSLFFYTPFNYLGIAPICLIISIVLFFSILIKNIKIPSINLVDLFLFSFLIYLPLNALINIDEANFNYRHIFAYYAVIIFYYFTLKYWIFNYLGNNSHLVLDYLTIGFILICLSGILDYILMQNSIYFHDYLPMPQANTTISGLVNTQEGFARTIGTRAKGFYTEPTLLGYALAAFGPVVLQYCYHYKKIHIFGFVLMIFIVALILSRSITAYVALGASFILTSIILFNVIRVKLSIKKSNLLKILIFSLIAIILIIYLYGLSPTEGSFNYYLKNYITHYYFVMSLKLKTLIAYFFFTDLTGVTEVTSSFQRAERWKFSINYILTSNKLSFGFGPGYESAGGLPGGSVLNWWINVLVEYGIIGLLILISSVFAAIYSIYINAGKYKFSLMTSLIVCVIYLSTHTGYYFPNLWIILVLSSIKLK